MELAMVPVAQFAFNFAIYKLQRTQEKKNYQSNTSLRGQ